MPFLTRFPLPAMSHDIQKLAITFSMAALTGWVFLALNFPAPFLMGSVFGVWIIGGSIKPLRPYLGVARWFHIPVVLGLGVFVGSFFQAEDGIRDFCLSRGLGDVYKRQKGKRVKNGI